MTFEILTIIVIINAVATIELWRRAARRPKKLRRKFRNRLLHSEPITPKHEPPPPPKETAVGITQEAQLQFFSDFEDFANVVNSWLADSSDIHHWSLAFAWRLQELPKSEITRIGAQWSPNYGRRYGVFHNQVRVGEIQLLPSSGYSAESPRVLALIELDWARLMSVATIEYFLVGIATHITESNPGTLEQLQTRREIALAMMGVLWETQEISKYENDDYRLFIRPEALAEMEALRERTIQGYGHLELRLIGSATFYLDRRQYLREQAAKAGQQKV
jgi:hypothetical protein